MTMTTTAINTVDIALVFPRLVEEILINETGYRCRYLYFGFHCAVPEKIPLRLKSKPRGSLVATRNGL